ncbi:hypothetical protein K431DRAFT_43896 [Polychaeton citri CBS 116435]|uniref:Uncharacterized protein n=1 Tax=Polychaeton citri CBS 116435 TaxID=1314669 RepID=A0A9P4PXJ0_9PEZI|nr:hypothetical protein K431DRAFT_43896 [Polychaeton citri CBS 116435]
MLFIKSYPLPFASSLPSSPRPLTYFLSIIWIYSVSSSPKFVLIMLPLKLDTIACTIGIIWAITVPSAVFATPVRNQYEVRTSTNTSIAQAGSGFSPDVPSFYTCSTKFSDQTCNPTALTNAKCKSLCTCTTQGTPSCGGYGICTGASVQKICASRGSFGCGPEA